MEIKYKQSEEWMAVKGFKNYQISSHGRVNTLDKYVTVNRYGKTFKRFYNGRIKAPKRDTVGYLFTDLWKNNKYKFVKIHRLVLCAWTNKNYNYSKQVNHMDGNKRNNNIDNLEWVTPKENIKHADINGLRHPSKGSKHYRAKLSEKDIPIIRKKFTGESGNLIKIAREYSVSPATIRDVIRRRTWKHL